MDDRHERNSLERLISNIFVAVILVASIVALVFYALDGVEFGYFTNLLSAIAITGLLVFITERTVIYLTNRHYTESGDGFDDMDLSEKGTIEFENITIFLVVMSLLIGFALICLGAAGSFGWNGNVLFLGLIVVGILIFWPAYRWLQPRFQPTRLNMLFVFIAIAGSFFADIEFTDPSEMPKNYCEIPEYCDE